MIGCIFTDCPACRELRSKDCHTFADASKPSGRHSLRVPVVELGNNLLLQQCVETFRFSSIPRRVFAMFSSVAYSPPNLRVIGLRPPTVQFGDVEPPIGKYLHSACS